MLNEIVTLVSVLVALAAVGIAAWQVRASLRSAERTNALPVISETFQEFRTADFRASVSNLITHAPVNAPAGGFDALPEDVREDAYKVCYFFDYMGTLIAYGIISEGIVIGVMGTRVMQIWHAMWPTIESERDLRQGDSYPEDAPRGFLVYYEHLVARVVELDGRQAASNLQRGLGIRRLPRPRIAEVHPQDPDHSTEGATRPGKE